MSVCERETATETLEVGVVRSMYGVDRVWWDVLGWAALGKSKVGVYRGLAGAGQECCC